MDKIYVPDTQKWIHYYQNLGKNGHNPYANYIHRGKKHIGGGSLSGTLRQFSIPVEPSHETENDDKSRLNVYHQCRRPLIRQKMK
jgi:hypothetical protein